MNIPSKQEIRKNTHEELAEWVYVLLSDKYWSEQSKHRDYYTKLNYKQASRIMELEFEMVKAKVNMEEDNVISMEEFKNKTKTGGKGPTEGDWLSDLVSGTEFLVRPKNGNQGWILIKFTHAGKKEGNVLLLPQQGEWMWVDPVEFCRVFEYRGILELPNYDDTE